MISSPSTTVTSPSPNCSSIPRLQVDLEQFLSNVVGSFSMTYIENGQVRILGNLNLESYADNSPPFVQKFASTPLGDGSNSSYYDVSYSELPSPLSSTSSSASSVATPMTAASSISPSCEFEQLPPQDLGYGYTTSTDQDSPDPSESATHASFNADFEANIDNRLIALSRSFPVARRTAFQIPFDIPHNKESESVILQFRESISSLRCAHLKCLAIELIKAIYPQRRKVYPYVGNKRLPQWPTGIQYKDPAHLFSNERTTLTLWLYLNPNHQLRKIIKAHKELAKRFDDDEISNLLNLSIKTRHHLSQSVSQSYN